MKHSRFYFVGIALLALFSLVACEEGTDTNKGTVPAKANATPYDDDAPVAFNTAVRTIPPKTFRNHWGTTTPAKKKKVELNAFYSRTARRVSLKKIRASIPYLFGGITWRDRAKRDMFNTFALTLGQADYLQLTKNNDAVTKLFMKLMDDMATNVCKQVIVADYKKPANQRVFVRNEKDVNANLRFIRLKFHAIYVPNNSTEGLSGLRKLYDKVLAKTKSARKAWELVCIATLTSPEFYTY